MEAQAIMKTTYKLCASLALCSLLACQTQGTKVRDSLVRSDRLAIENPVDIAVLPIENRTHSPKFERLLETMHLEISHQLVQRRYSPLSQGVVEASARGQLPPSRGSLLDEAVMKDLARGSNADAILALQIRTWDESSLLSRSIVRFVAHVRLLGRESGQTLWAGGLEGQVRAGGLGTAPRDPERRAKAAVAEFALQLCNALPARIP